MGPAFCADTFLLQCGRPPDGQPAPLLMPAWGATFSATLLGVWYNGGTNTLSSPRTSTSSFRTSQCVMMHSWQTAQGFSSKGGGHARKSTMETLPSAKVEPLSSEKGDHLPVKKEGPPSRVAGATDKGPISRSNAARGNVMRRHVSCSFVKPIADTAPLMKIIANFRQVKFETITGLSA